MSSLKVLQNVIPITLDNNRLMQIDFIYPSAYRLQPRTQQGASEPHPENNYGTNFLTFIIRTRYDDPPEREVSSHKVECIFGVIKLNAFSKIKCIFGDSQIFGN